MVKKRAAKFRSMRGFEARYGATVRKRYMTVLSSFKKPYKCLQCDSKSVWRQSVGIWKCKKCSAIFTGGAYEPETKIGVIAKRSTKGLTPAIETSVLKSGR